MKIKQETFMFTPQHTEQIKNLPQPLLTWYAQAKRSLPWRENHDPYRVWVSEIMLQQTRVAAVIPYFQRFMEALPTVSDLAKAPQPILLKLWEGLGYYSRVRNMHKAAVIIMGELDGIFPFHYHELLKLPGIGEYTAGAIASIAFGEAVPAVDGNVLRVVARLLACDQDITKPYVKKEYMRLLMQSMPKDCPGDFNQALMELGATVCLPNQEPQCMICPVSHLCTGNENKNPLDYPVKTPKKERKIENKTILLLWCEGKIAIHRRKEKGLLAGLWEFPSLEGAYTQTELEKHLKEQDIGWTQLKQTPAAKHIFTHIQWEMQGYELQLCHPISTQDWVWVTKEELLKDYTVPSAFSAFIKRILG